MKTIYNYLLLAVLAIIMHGCNTDLDLNESVSGYYSVSTTFVYPQEANANYVILLDGDTVKNGSGMVSRSGKSLRKLEVFEKGKNTADLSQDIEINENKLFQFIKLPGQQVVIYEADKYASFKPVVLFQQGQESNYQISFNGIDLQNQVANYLPIDKLTGVLEIRKKTETTLLFDQKLTIENGSQINVMQLSETNFLHIPEDNEPEPESNQYTKIRFFYTADAFPGVSRIKIIVYEWDNFTELGSVEMNVGELSPYLLIDWSKGGGLYQTLVDITDAENERILLDGNENTDAYITTGRNIYKFATCRIPPGGVVINTENNLSTRW